VFPSGLRYKGLALFGCDAAFVRRVSWAFAGGLPVGKMVLLFVLGFCWFGWKLIVFIRKFVQLWVTSAMKYKKE